MLINSIVGKDLINAHSAEADTTATYEILLAQLKMRGVEYEDREETNQHQ